MKQLFSNFSMHWYHVEDLLKQSIGSQPRVPDSGGQGQRLRIYIPNKFRDDVAMDYSFGNHSYKVSTTIIKRLISSHDFITGRRLFFLNTME